MPDHDYRHGGLKDKYFIAKKDGTPVEPKAEYFVLRLDADPHARAAAIAYASSVVHENPVLASELIYEVGEIERLQQANEERAADRAARRERDLGPVEGVTHD